MTPPLQHLAHKNNNPPNCNHRRTHKQHPKHCRKQHKPKPKHQQCHRHCNNHCTNRNNCISHGAVSVAYFISIAKKPSQRKGGLPNFLLCGSHETTASPPFNPSRMNVKSHTSRQSLNPSSHNLSTGGMLKSTLFVLMGCTMPEQNLLELTIPGPLT